MTIKSALPTDAEIYAVNWLGARLFRVKPVRQDGQSLTIAVSRSDDVFFYEIVAPAAKNAGR